MVFDTDSVASRQVVRREQYQVSLELETEAPGDVTAPERRRFLERFIGWSAALVGAVTLVPGIGLALRPIVAGAGANRRKLVFQPGQRATKDTFVSVRYDGQEETAAPLFVRLQDDGTPLVLSSVCTHAGCAVQWHGSQNEFVCPCHGGHFDAAGRNVSGPPPRPLDHLKAELANGAIFVEVPQA